MGNITEGMLNIKLHVVMRLTVYAVHANKSHVILYETYHLVGYEINRWYCPHTPLGELFTIRIHP